MDAGSDALIFRPVARMVKILGEHLIRDNTVGVMELIKNGYDADAERVTVELRNLADPARTEVIIEDDGTGMDEATIRGPWSEPAHGGKQTEKDKLHRSKRGRLPLGEKGVGRFAAQKLGRYVEMTTRPRGSNIEYHVDIDWNIFDKDDSYLDEIAFPLEKRSPQVFVGEKHGTRLVVREARIPWRRGDVEKLQASLIRLLSPISEIKSFSVFFKCPEYPELENLDRGEILNRFQFKVDCSIDEKGMATYTYFNRSPEGNVEKVAEKLNLWSRVNDDWEKYDPTCGPVRVVTSAWLRGAENIGKYNITRTQLSGLAGISVYRDGFRILPYGDRGDDWLGLDLRRTLEPGDKYGNNQVIGQVETTQEKNRNLIDKTNREGLQETQAFYDLRDLVLGVVSLLEQESLEQRSKATKTHESTKALKEKIETLTKQIADIKDVSQGTDTSANALAPGRTPTGIEGPKTDVQKGETVKVSIEKLKVLEDQVKEIGTTATETMKELSDIKEEKREAFLHLMGIGLAAERFAHEFDRLVGLLSANVKSVLEEHPFNKTYKGINYLVEVLRNEVALLGAARYVRKVDKDAEAKVREVIAMSLKAHSASIEENNIQIQDASKNDFATKISTASLSQVLDNIITNAIYWLSTKSEVNDRKLCIDVDAEERTITISNNGGLIPANIKRSLFKGPFVTSKPDGRGLGLYISNEILKKNNASIELLPEDHPKNRYQNASFLVTFH